MFALYVKAANYISKFAKKEEGISAIEYALIAALIALVVIGGATYLGTAVNSKFSAIGSAV